MNDSDDMMLKVSRAVQLRELCEGAALALPDDYKVVDVSIFRQRPMRRVERVELATFAEFVRYLKLRWRDGVSRCFVTEDCVHGVIDFAEADGGAAWQNDEVMFKVRPSFFWQNWRSRDRKWMEQRAFVEFLEDNLDVIERPSGAEVYALAAEFRAHKAVEYVSTYRTQNGDICLTYNEVNKATQKNMTLPSEIELHMPLVAEAEELTAFKMRARIKVRVSKEDGVMFCYELVRPDRFESLWKAELQKALAAEGVEVFLGKLSRSNASWFADSLER